MCVCVCVCVCVTQCVAIRFRLCWRHSGDLFVCFGAKPTQRTEDEISHETRSGGGKDGLSEDKESQSTTKEPKRTVGLS